MENVSMNNICCDVSSKYFCLETTLLTLNEKGADVSSSTKILLTFKLQIAKNTCFLIF